MRPLLFVRLLLASALWLASLHAPVGALPAGGPLRPQVADAHHAKSHPGLAPDASAPLKISAPLASYLLPIRPSLAAAGAAIGLAPSHRALPRALLRSGPRGARSPPSA